MIYCECLLSGLRVQVPDAQRPVLGAAADVSLVQLSGPARVDCVAHQRLDNILAHRVEQLIYRRVKSINNHYLTGIFQHYQKRI